MYREETPDNRLCVARLPAERKHPPDRGETRRSEDEAGNRHGWPGELTMLQPLTLKAAVEATDVLENRTFDEISVGDSASLTRTRSRDDIALFAVMSGDVNPAHLDERCC